MQYPSKPAVSQEAKNFIRRCLAYRKDERMDVATMVKETYLCPPQSRQQRLQAAAAQQQQQQAQQQAQQQQAQQQQQQQQSFSTTFSQAFMGQNSGDS